MEYPLSEKALRVLRAVRETAMDGYTVASRAGVSGDDLSAPLTELQSRGLIAAKGDLSPSRVGESYLYVPTEAADTPTSCSAECGTACARPRS